MATTLVTPKAEAEMIRKQSTLLDLATFENVTLVKEKPYTPVTNAKEAMERLGNSTEKFLEVINDGLRAVARRELATDSTIAWQALDDEGNLVTFDGIPADQLKVNQTILTMAKAVFGYNKDMTADQKAEAKASAVNLIRSNSVIYEGLKKNAAASISAE